MSNSLLSALLGQTPVDDYTFGLASKKRCTDGLLSELKSGTQLIAEHARHAICPYDEPPAPLPYGGTGGAEQIIVCSQSGTFVQPANAAGFMAWSPSYVNDINNIFYSGATYVSTVIDMLDPGVGSSTLSGSSFDSSQLNRPTKGGDTENNAGIKCKWAQAFMRFRCVDNMLNRGGDGILGQVTQQGGVDAAGIGTSDFNWLQQQKLCKKLLVNGEWNDWHCTTFESDLRYEDEQFPLPACGLAVNTQATEIAFEPCRPFFCFLYPNGTAHTWEYEVYFTFQADGNNGPPSAGAIIQPNIQNIPHVPAAANINAALAYARSKIPAGNTKHTSIGHHISNFFKSVGHDLDHGLNDAFTGAAAAGAAALFL